MYFLRFCHPDFPGKGVFTLVVCLSTDHPYRMAISRRRMLFKGERLAPHQYREVELAANDYILFPAALCHKCIAPESNARVIVNALLKM